MTFGPGDASQPASGPDGLVAFVGSTSAQNIWAMPIESETGVTRGEPRQVTDGAGPYGRASYSRDRRRLAFQAFRGKGTIMIKEMETDRIADLSVAARPFGPVVSPDGTRLVFPSVGGGASRIATQGGEIRRVCEDCEPGEWTPDGQSIAWTAQASGLARIQLISRSPPAGLDRSSRPVRPPTALISAPTGDGWRFAPPIRLVGRRCSWHLSRRQRGAPSRLGQHQRGTRA